MNDVDHGHDNGRQSMCIQFKNKWACLQVFSIVWISFKHISAKALSF